MCSADASPLLGHCSCVPGYRDPYDRILNLAGADIVMLYSPLDRYSVGTEIEVKSKRS